MALNLTELLLGATSGAAAAVREGVEVPDAAADWGFAAEEEGVDSRA